MPVDSQQQSHLTTAIKEHFMKIVVIGASGNIGQPLADALAKRHEVVRVARTHGDYQVDIISRAPLERVFETVAPFDAVVCAAGDARFKPLERLTDEDFAIGLISKLMG
jgi:nucleoside-diphosphate-sugar epimerase